MERVRVMWPRLPAVDDVVPYLRRIDAARTYSNFGPLVAELEARYAERFGVPASRVATCCSATLGIEGVVAGLPPSASVHCPTWTFPASALAIRNADRRLVWHDVSTADWQIDGADEAVPGDAVMPVLPFGSELDLGRWSAWDTVVVDAAASGGMRSRDLSGLPETWAVVVSLHATKVLGAGEGGLVVFGSEEAADRFRDFTNLGFVTSRSSDQYGTNAKMPEVVAAYALAALDQWEVEESEWRRARQLTRAAEDLLGLTSLCSDYPGVNPYWMVRFESGDERDAAEAALAAVDVETRRWWERRCDLMPALSAGVPSPTGYDGADELVATTLGLPFHRDLTDAHVDRVVSALLPAMAAHR